MGGKDKRKASGGIDFEGLLGQNVRDLTVLSKMKPVEVAEQRSYINWHTFKRMVLLAVWTLDCEQQGQKQGHQSGEMTVDWARAVAGNVKRSIRLNILWKLDMGDMRKREVNDDWKQVNIIACIYVYICKEKRTDSLMF